LPARCLKEKGLEFVSHYVDLLRFEQHAPEFVRINPNGGQIPVSGAPHFPDMLSAELAPRTWAWLARVEARPATQAALAMPNKVPELLRTFGN
jgi:glutathione S-transferase